MAVRTTEEAVKKIIEVDASIDLTPFIEVANDLVTEHCTSDDYSDTKLEQIERWLSAYFYALRDPRPTQERADGAGGQTFQIKIDLYFAQNQWGQTAMLLDKKGNLSALSNQIKQGGKMTVGISWMGSTETEVEGYDLD